MDILKYQELSKRTISDTQTKEDLYKNAILGLIGESGEVIDTFKKVLFHGHDIAKHREHLTKEFGDVMWYISALCTAIDTEMDFEYKPGNENDLYNGCLNLSLSVTNLIELEDETLTKEKIESIYEVVCTLLEYTDTDIKEVFETNVKKLEERYPEGFDKFRSINR